MRDRPIRLDRIRTTESTPVLEVAKKIAELSGSGDNVTYIGEQNTQLVPNDPDHKYTARVDIITGVPKSRVLASITYGVGRPTPFTADEALSGLFDDFHVEICAIEVTPKLIEQVRQSLGPLN